MFDNNIDKNSDVAKSFIGVVPQEINFSQFETCLEIVVNQGGFYGIGRSTALKRAEKYLRRLDLWEKRDERSRNLSGGMKRRLMIARALVHEPKMLILDEPTAGVDVELRRSTWDFLTGINQKGVTILLTTHYLEEAESLCNNIAIINHGEIVENTSMKELLSQLNRETFIFDTIDPIKELPNLKNFDLKIIDSTTIEVEIDHRNNINEFFYQPGHNTWHCIRNNQCQPTQEKFPAIFIDIR